MTALPRSAFPLALLHVLAAAASAQQPADSIALSGWVVDARSRQPLPSAYVVVQGVDVRMVTGEGGAFRLMVPRADGYEILVGRFGYMEMHYEIGEEELAEQLVGEQLILPLEPQPLPLEGLEVTVDRLAELEERLESRTRAYSDGPSRAVGRERIERSGPGSALDLVLEQERGLFECWNSPGELCARSRRTATFRSPGGSGESRVRVCLDDRRLWGGTAELHAIPKEEIYRLELYGFGGRGQVRLYTRWFMARKSAEPDHALPPAEFGC